ncbi:MAG TPA: dephospho-CoA kinase [Bacteroidia bacterium]|nr:dephospho-CoA kinase [Bacteroidia bacterium]
MLKVGLTGGIGSGKTVVATFFRQLGVPVFDADNEARLLTENNAAIITKIRNTFGKDFFNADESLNRTTLAKIVFGDKEKLAVLNAIIHPAVKDHFEHWLEQNQNAKYIIKEAAILFESGSNSGLDKIIFVTSPEEIRIKRVIMRDNSSREKILAVMKNQWSDDERRKYSDYLIINDDSTLVIPQVLKLHEMFSVYN